MEAASLTMAETDKDRVDGSGRPRLPSWLKTKVPSGEAFERVNARLREAAVAAVSPTDRAPSAGVNRIRFQGTLSILFRIPPKRYKSNLNFRPNEIFKEIMPLAPKFYSLMFLIETLIIVYLAKPKNTNHG